LLFVEPKSSDRPNLLKAVAELQNYEREPHEARLPGEQIADAYTRLMLSRAKGGGLVLVAEHGHEVVGFAAGWIEQEELLRAPWNAPCWIMYR